MFTPRRARSLPRLLFLTSGKFHCIFCEHIFVLRFSEIHQEKKYLLFCWWCTSWSSFCNELTSSRLDHHSLVASAFMASLITAIKQLWIFNLLANLFSAWVIDSYWLKTERRCCCWDYMCCVKFKNLKERTLSFVSTLKSKDII